jgi:maltooligosyltrehalose synthase
VVAFARTGGLAVVVPRLARPGETWAGTTVELPGGTWTDVLTGDAVTSDGTGGTASVGVASLLRRFPVAVLGSEA